MLTAIDVTFALYGSVNDVVEILPRLVSGETTSVACGLERSRSRSPSSAPRVVRFRARGPRASLESAIRPCIFWVERKQIPHLRVIAPRTSPPAFWTGRMIFRDFGTVVRQFSPGTRRMRTSTRPEIAVESKIFKDGM